MRSAAVVREDAGEGPTTNNLVRPVGHGRSDLLAPADGEFVKQIGQQHVRVVEVRKRAVQPPVVNICRCAAVCRAQASASSGAGRVNGHVVNGLAKGVRKTEIPTLLEAATHGDE